MMDKIHISRNNCFDVIRLLASIQVVIVHYFEHLDLNRAAIRWLEIFPGVPIFFVISGFLVSASYERCDTKLTYAMNRVLRIYPGLWVCLLISLLSVFLVSGQPAAWVEIAPWLAAQLSIAQFYNPGFLREYGVGVLNGSLWTIPVEIQFYICVPLIYLILERMGWRLRVTIAGLIGLIVISQIYRVLSKGSDDIIFKLFFVTALPHLYMFVFGILLQKYWPAIQPIMKKFASVFIASYFVLSIALPAFGIPVLGNDINPVSALLLGLIVIYLANIEFVSAAKLLGGNDISYGLYIYHMPVVNVFVELGKTNSYIYFGVATLISVLLAIFSWRVVEKPALKLKRLFSQNNNMQLSLSNVDRP